MAAPLLQAEPHIRPVRPETVSRPRLIERLNAGLHHKLTLVSAPAGLGKTTLLSGLPLPSVHRIKPDLDEVLGQSWSEAVTLWGLVRQSRSNLETPRLADAPGGFWCVCVQLR